MERMRARQLDLQYLMWKQNYKFAFMSQEMINHALLFPFYQYGKYQVMTKTVCCVVNHLWEPFVHEGQPASFDHWLLSVPRSRKLTEEQQPYLIGGGSATYTRQYFVASVLLMVSTLLTFPAIPRCPPRPPPICALQALLMLNGLSVLYFRKHIALQLLWSAFYSIVVFLSISAFYFVYF